MLLIRSVASHAVQVQCACAHSTTRLPRQRNTFVLTPPTITTGSSREEKKRASAAGRTLPEYASPRNLSQCLAYAGRMPGSHKSRRIVHQSAWTPSPLLPRYPSTKLPVVFRHYAITTSGLVHFPVPRLLIAPLLPVCIASSILLHSFHFSFFGASPRSWYLNHVSCSIKVPPGTRNPRIDIGPTPHRQTLHRSRVDRDTS